ncbi:circularly permutated Ras protein 1 [Notolabrus celidotus]|uniref:circularly permutated Ras protein 1 n=1 Tax=Notolabrus celidotus TaxID=1203425 RepID=UPI0014907DC1|nr:circularly permutated Ras protein 1 [Notolabrus celidotus]
MEFACSHVVCNWRPDGAPSTGLSLENTYGNIVKHQEGELPPPLPPRSSRKPRPTSLPPLHLLTLLPPPGPLSLPPPVPPRLDKQEGPSRLTANINVVSLSVGKLVDISQASCLESFQSPVICGKCSAALSCLSFIQRSVWVCEFCGHKNSVNDSVERVCVGQLAGVHSDDIYLPNQSDDVYQNLEDTLVVFCVDISGSMSVTTEVTNSSGSQAHISRLQGMQDALQRSLTSLLQQSPHRRVALVTFNDDVVIYGDGTSVPLTLSDWALLDYDHIWQQSVAYTIPHCIAETYGQLAQRVQELSENGATCLGSAALASVAVASRYPGSKVILCTDGRANIGLGEIEQTPSPSSSSLASYFYRKLALEAVKSGVIISVMTFEGTDCRLAEIGRLADTTGGRVNTVSIGTVAKEIQSASVDNVLATGVTATLLAPEGVYFPYEDDKMSEIGNVTKGLEITLQFAVKPEFTGVFLQRSTLPFQVQLSFKTRDQQKVMRIITELRPVTTCSGVWAGSLNTAVLGVHCVQLCARLTMEGRVQEAQRQLRAQQDLLSQISKQRQVQQEDNIYSNWLDTMTTIFDNITTDSQTLSDEAAKVMYQMKRASSVKTYYSNSSEIQRKGMRKKKKSLMEGF